MLQHLPGSPGNIDLRGLRLECGETLLQLYYRANAGHIGSSLSCLDMLIDIGFRRLRPQDQLILSKGHAAAALYTVLARCGRLDRQELETFYKDGTRLAAHPPCLPDFPAIPFGTGSLGHGLSLAAGLVFSQRYTQKDFKVYCVLSDGDCDEGSTWEAAMFAAHHGLKNLCVVIDANGLQGLGKTAEVLNLEPLAEKWSAFGFETISAKNGNSFDDLAQAHQALKAGGAPQCIIARTTKGHGVSFMENRLEWHYLPMTPEQLKKALEENRARYA